MEEFCCLERQDLLLSAGPPWDAKIPEWAGCCVIIQREDVKLAAYYAVLAIKRLQPRGHCLLVQRYKKLSSLSRNKPSLSAGVRVLTPEISYIYYVRNAERLKEVKFLRLFVSWSTSTQQNASAHKAHLKSKSHVETAINLLYTVKYHIFDLSALLLFLSLTKLRLFLIEWPQFKKNLVLENKTIFYFCKRFAKIDFVHLIYIGNINFLLNPDAHIKNGSNWM